MATLIPSTGSCVARMTGGADSIQIMTMKVSKGLEFPVVALPGVGHMPAAGEDEQEAARVFYVAATRATQRLVIGVGGDSGFAEKLDR
jgi:superfamily I DNA/RNA helicase